MNLAAGNLESLGLREGPAVRNAMLAVALAKLGHRGGETSLEGRAGLYQAYAGNNEGRERPDKFLIEQHRHENGD